MKIILLTSFVFLFLIVPCALSEESDSLQQNDSSFESGFGDQKDELSVEKKDQNEELKNRIISKAKELGIPSGEIEKRMDTLVSIAKMEGEDKVFELLNNVAQKLKEGKKPEEFDELEKKQKESEASIFEIKEKINKLAKEFEIPLVEIEKRVRFFVDLYKMKGESDVKKTLQELSLTLKKQKLFKEIEKYERSKIEKLITGEIEEEISTDLKQFGYDVFSNEVTTFAPVENSPVGPGYIVGPGDEFIINTWGKLNLEINATVDRNGQINIPNVGTMYVWGLTSAELKRNIKNNLSKYYSDFDLSISFKKIRTINVYVTGEVKNPGSYEVSALASMFDALFITGGPTKDGSLRNIQLIRGSTTVSVLDFYDFLLSGQKTKDAKLMSGDTIFVPPVGAVVGIAGYVKRPAIYELKEGTATIKEVLNMVGGLTIYGKIGRLSVERVEKHDKKVAVDFKFNEEEFKKILDSTGKISGQDVPQEFNTMLLSGDLVKVFPIQPKSFNTIYLEGHVLTSGKYEFKEGLKIKDIVKSTADLKDKPYLDYAYIKRVSLNAGADQIIGFIPKQLFEGDETQNLELKDQDTVRFFSLEEIDNRNLVFIAGSVKKPGNYPYYENMQVVDLIYQAGGITQDAFLESAEVTQLIYDQTGTQAKITTIDLRNAFKNDLKHNLTLKPNSQVYIRKVPDWYYRQQIELIGEVRFPGIYSFAKGEKLSSILERAGGFTQEAYIAGIVFTRESAKKLQEKRLEDLIRKQEEFILTESTKLTSSRISEQQSTTLNQTLMLRKELVNKLKGSKISGRVIIYIKSLDKLKSSKYDITLEHGDSLTVPKNPMTVNVSGEVYNPNALIYEKNEKIKYYLDRVGGPTTEADEDSMFLVKADGTVVSQRNYDKWYRSFRSIKLYPGDSILVPTYVKPELDMIGLTKDVTTIFFQLATTAGIIYGIGK